MGVTETELNRIISDAKHGIIDLDQRQKWEEFKREWSEEDHCIWNGLLGRLTIGSDGKLHLCSPLSDDEKAWARNLVERAEQKGLA